MATPAAAAAAAPDVLDKTLIQVILTPGERADYFREAKKLIRGDTEPSPTKVLTTIEALQSGDRFTSAAADYTHSLAVRLNAPGIPLGQAAVTALNKIIAPAHKKNEERSAAKTRDVVTRIYLLGTGAKNGFYITRDIRHSAIPGAFVIRQRLVDEKYGFSNIQLVAAICNGRLYTRLLSAEQLTQLQAFFQLLATDPKRAILESGKTAGNCCFCGRVLTDTTSKANGYGPTCEEYFRHLIRKEEEEEEKKKRKTNK